MDVGVRQLKGNLSRYLAEVRRGEVITVTDRGEPVARLIPAREGQSGAARRLAELIVEGAVEWSGRQPTLAGPRVRLKMPGQTISDIVIENRR